MKKPAEIKMPIYLDNAASTPMDPRVIAAMTACLSKEGFFGNSASKDHVYGWQAANVIDKARDQIASSVGCSILEIIFTSGATESNNLAIKGLAYGLRKQHDPRNQIITTTVEHKAVLECCEQLSQDGFDIVYLDPQSDGSISLEQLEAALTERTFLVSISQANSVLGTLNDIKALSAAAKRHGAYYHTDCAQSNGILDIDLEHTDVSLATLTPEKIYGPKGIGALYIRHDLNLPLDPLIVGGGHEKGLRGGTLATHQIAAMGEAFAIMQQERAEVSAKVSALRQRLIEHLKTIPDCALNGSQEHHLPGIVSVTFHKLDGRQLLPSLRKVACSTGSACSSKELKPSYVLSAIGLSDEDARASLRLSVGRFNTEQEIDDAAAAIKEVVTMLRSVYQPA